MGSFKTALFIFLLPAAVLYPNGLLCTIGYAMVCCDGLGGKPMIVLVLLFGVGNALIHILSSVNLFTVPTYIPIAAIRQNFYPSNSSLIYIAKSNEYSRA